MRKFVIWGVALCFQCSVVQAQLSEQDRFEVAKNLDIYNSLVKELDMFYVDSLDIKKIVQENINFMLRRLDPYNEYFQEEDVSGFVAQTTGEYGGVGALITSRNGVVYVIEPYEGMPADLAGIQAGDELLEIDGINLSGKSSSFASDHLKGQSNTKVKIKYQRVGDKKPREVTIDRKRLQLNPVTYYGVLTGNIGYIYISDFNTYLAQSMKAAFDDLKKQGITSLIIDVRDNLGGVVEDCLEILNYFLPKGELLLTMKGKVRQLDRTYRATQQAIDTVIPIVVLVNRNSASASEILAGTFQDTDRAVIVGNRTYGKGLVQSQRPLPYNGRLKLTTAKYYIPSGRNIQAIDYSHRNEDGNASSIPDSLTKVFYTSKGRPVHDGGGIVPDFVLEEKNTPTLVYYMDMENIFLDFVVQWRLKHPTVDSPEKFVLTDSIYNTFKDFAKSKDFNYDRQSERALASLKEIMEFEGYMEPASEEFKALENKLKPDLERDLELYKDQLSDILAKQIMKHYYYAKGEIKYSLRDDYVKKAVEVLSDKTLHNKSLSEPEN
ncbi:MAG: S41 family peptidase [Candidatus Symbiothrix sp.]|jgi:carboxyl-terminal processing protease|nr:S41 family peptidase [Candidatus Symbiothrix sp.]